MPSSEPIVTGSEVIGRNKWTTIIKDALLFASGRAGEYIVVERKCALMVIPLVYVNGVAYTYMVRQFRHPIGRSVWQFPMGTLEENVDAEEHARQELREETGVVAVQMKSVCRFFVDPGLSRQECQMFIAEGVIEGGKQELDDTEADLVAARIPIHDVENMIENGDIVDSWGFSGVYWLMKYLGTR